MNNRRLMVLFAVLFSVVFSILYYFLFSLTLSSPTNEKRVLYMNQVGLYEKADSVAKMKENLKNAGLESYELKQGKLTAVVCSVNTQEKKTKEDQKKLQELSYSYLVKKVTVEDESIVKMIDDKQYAEALERIGE